MKKRLYMDHKDGKVQSVREKSLLKILDGKIKDNMQWSDLLYEIFEDNEIDIDKKIELIFFIGRKKGHNDQVEILLKNQEENLRHYR